MTLPHSNHVEAKRLLDASRATLEHASRIPHDEIERAEAVYVASDRIERRAAIFATLHLADQVAALATAIQPTRDRQPEEPQPELSSEQLAYKPVFPAPAGWTAGTDTIDGSEHWLFYDHQGMEQRCPVRGEGYVGACNGLHFLLKGPHPQGGTEWRCTRDGHSVRLTADRGFFGYTPVSQENLSTPREEAGN